jgi:hypothetical protein
MELEDNPTRNRADEDHEASLKYLVEVVLGTYHEMPGLVLDLRQAARLFGLAEPTCRVVLDELVRQHRLNRGEDGQYLAV